MDQAAVRTEEIISHSAAETIAAGERFARTWMQRSGTIVALRGDLASGKTHFTKGIAHAFAIDEHEISSPTFALANEYAITIDGKPGGMLYHLDCYRFERPEELLELGVEEYLYPHDGMTVIEWAERIEEYLPAERIDVRFETLSPTDRRITITPHFA
ncbi:MAG: tRNA (adenosine(37)-N6)-threonylcarbamoyltransferase complex ATPase subunit type 1 TsaE [Bacteroidetes bacterium]|nr:tRNA (adenosine(37)-N6)-threonylcarbamoyltransferase complex ATPase subunit type 1 TsaE [Bacteroidota bacterium]